MKAWDFIPVGDQLWKWSRYIESNIKTSDTIGNRRESRGDKINHAVWQHAIGSNHQESGMNNNTSRSLNMGSSGTIQERETNNRLILNNRGELIGITKATGINQAILKVIESTIHEDRAIS